MRDSQRSHVYAAENLMCRLLDRAAKEHLSTLEIAGSTISVPIERKFGSIEAVQRYVDLVLDRVAADYHASAKVRVRTRRGDGSAHYRWNEIAIPDHNSWNRSWAMRELVVLHEIAHHLAIGKQHNPKFVSAFADLVERFMGPEAALMLRVLTHESGVSHG